MPSIAHLTDDELLTQLRAAVDALPDAPAPLQRAAEALWKQAPTSTSTSPPFAAALHRVLATLSFDSWATPAPALGLRSTPGATRHWLFSTEGRDIDLRVAPSGTTWQVSGQVLGPDAAGLVLLATGDGTMREVALSDLGEFRFDAVAAGAGVVTLRFDDLEIVLPPIAVGGTPP